MPDRRPNASEYGKLLRALRRRVELLDKILVEPVAAPTTTPDIYAVPVQAYCVLCHAALEEYFENIGTTTLTIAIDQWNASRKVTESLLALFSATDTKIAYEDDRTATVSTSFTRHREMLTEAKRKYSSILNNNHGTDIKYLRKILYPLAIDFDESTLLASLAQVADYRGEFAHKMRATRHVAPEDARNWVKDCLQLGLVVAGRARTRVQ